MSPPTSHLMGCVIFNAYASHILQCTLGLYSCQLFTVTFSLSINLTIPLLDKSFFKKKFCFIFYTHKHPLHSPVTRTTFWHWCSHLYETFLLCVSYQVHIHDRSWRGWWWSWGCQATVKDCASVFVRRQFPIPPTDVFDKMSEHGVFVTNKAGNLSQNMIFSLP